MAFALLAMVTGFVVVSWSENMDKASDALIRRELREVADTVFRRILYEIQEHNHLDSGTLEEIYGEWTGFRGLAKTKWQWYTYELYKVEKVAAGSAGESDDAESLFGNDGEDDESEFTAAEGEEGAVAGIQLLEVTLFIREVGDSSNEPLITLRTYIRPPDLGEQR